MSLRILNMVWATLTLNVVQTVLKRHSNKTMLNNQRKDKILKSWFNRPESDKGHKKLGKITCACSLQNRYDLMDSQRQALKEG